MGGYTPIINGRKVTEEDGTVGKRFGASKKFGLLLSGSYDYNGRGIDDIEPAPDLATLPGGKTQPWFDAMDIRQYAFFRKRWAMNGDADYRIQNGDVFLKWLYSDFKDDDHKWVYSLTDNTPPSDVTLLNGNGYNTADNAPEGTPSLSNPYGASDDEGTGALILGGNQVLNTAWYSWNLSAARSFQSGGALANTSFSYIGGGTSNCQFDPSATTSDYLPQWSSACYSEAYNPANWELDSGSDISRNEGLTAQLNLAGSGAFAKRYSIGARSATFQFGGRFTNAHKYADTYTLDWTPLDAVAIPLTTFPNYLTNKNYYLGGKYKLGYLPSGPSINDYLNTHMNQFSLYSTKGIDASFFNIVEPVGAGYAMNTIDISSRLRFYAGLRVEHTSDNVHNFTVGDPNDPNFTCPNSECTIPNSFSGSYTTILPSASLNYGFDSSNQMRFVYARGLSRPDYSDLAQSLSWTTNANGSHKGQVSFGNANLKAETGDDIDVLYDHYFNSFGMFSAGIFYKYLANPIILQSGTLDNYLPPGAPQSDMGSWFYQQPVNAGHAWVTGIEASYIQHFTFLPGAWRGLGMNANWGHNWSGTIDIPGRSDNPPLQRTDPNAFNITPTYDHGRLSLAAGFTFNQASIFQYQYADGMAGGVNGPLSDIYAYNHFQVGAQGSVGLGRGLALIVSGENLNNSVFGFYQGSPQYMIQREYYEPTYSMGLRWNSARER
jgi:TonB-dependent receptor